MMIPLEPLNRSGHPAYWANGRQRLATCTSVRVLDSNTLLCSSLVGQAMYLMRFDLETDTHEIAQRVDTSFSDRPACTDLMDFDGIDRIVTSNCEDSSASLYRIDGDRIRHESDLIMTDADSGFCHGASFVPGTDLVCVAIQSGAESLQLWSRSTGGCVLRIPDPGWVPKDACFLSPRRALALYSRRAKEAGVVEDFRSKIALLEFDEDHRSYRKLAEWPLAVSQLDCIHSAAEQVFVSDQGNDRILHFRLGSDLVELPPLEGYSFPHGVHFHAPTGLLAVTNYGSNGVDLRQLEAIEA